MSRRSTRRLRPSRRLRADEQQWEFRPLFGRSNPEGTRTVSIVPAGSERYRLVTVRTDGPMSLGEPVPEHTHAVEVVDGTAVAALRRASEIVPDGGWLASTMLMRCADDGPTRYLLQVLPAAEQWFVSVLLVDRDVPDAAVHEHVALGAFSSWEAAVDAADRWEPDTLDPCNCQ